MDKHKQILNRLTMDLADLQDHQEGTFERLRQALEKIKFLEALVKIRTNDGGNAERRAQALELALKDKDTRIKELEERIKELEGEMEEMIHPDNLGEYAQNMREP